MKKTSSITNRKRKKKEGKIVVKDMSHTTEVGFDGAEIMLNSRQKRMRRDLKRKRAKKSGRKEYKKDDAKSLKALAENAVTEFNNRIEAGKEDETFIQKWERIKGSFVDIDKLIRSGKMRTASGRMAYIPPTAVPVMPLDPASIKMDASMLIIGSRRSGKSWLLRWLCYHWRDRYDQIWVFTRTKQNGWYQVSVYYCCCLQ